MPGSAPTRTGTSAGRRLGAGLGCRELVEVLLIWAIVGGIVGAAIASSKGGSSASGCIVGVLLGPIGWILIALTAGPSGRCPHCGGRIPKNVAVCSHCGRETKPGVGAPSRRTPSQQRDVSAQVDALERLADLRDRGVLTESEFAAQKKHLLGE